jgi:hypothetical protein
VIGAGEEEEVITTLFFELFPFPLAEEADEPSSIVATVRPFGSITKPFFFKISIMLSAVGVDTGSRIAAQSFLKTDERVSNAAAKDLPVDAELDPEASDNIRERETVGIGFAV